jgi:hypothetical protein
VKALRQSLRGDEVVEPVVDVKASAQAARRGLEGLL